MRVPSSLESEVVCPLGPTLPSQSASWISQDGCVFGLTKVCGQSMTPTLLDGDVLLVRFGGGVRPGDVVLGRFQALDAVVVKRAIRAAEVGRLRADGADPGRPGAGGWLVASDNPRVGTDSSVHGPMAVLGVAWLRWRLGPGAVAAGGRFWILQRWLPVRLTRQAPVG